MASSNGFSALELRATLRLASVFGLRMFGLFIILPVFALYARQLPGGDNHTLIGVVLGVYGLTQAILQIPFGWMSDRIGRKPVLYAGLLLFALGSLIGALATNIYLFILARVIQGSGAISAAVLALVADVTEERNRTKAMAIIGSTIGVTFALSIVLGPLLNAWIGVPAMFGLTGILAIAAMAAVRGVKAPVFSGSNGVPMSESLGPELRKIAQHPELMRLNFGTFVLHAILTALFVVVPFSLERSGLAGAKHWQVYLPVMLASFVLMLPLVSMGDRRQMAKRTFLIGIAVLLLGQVWLGFAKDAFWPLAVGLTLFFTGFNALEATLPSLVSKLAPPEIKGTSIGVFSSLQFLGAALGGLLGGALSQRWGAAAVHYACIVLCALWLVVSLGMRFPAPTARHAARDIEDNMQEQGG
jgi:MFS family permease